MGDALGIPPTEDAVQIEKRLPRETGQGKCQKLEAGNSLEVEIHPEAPPGKASGREPMDNNKESTLQEK